MNRRSGGSGKYEFAVVASILAILVLVLLQRLGFYEEKTEAAAIEQTVADLRAAVRLKSVTLVLRGHEEEAAALAGQNPMLWLPAPPPSYRGEISTSHAQELAGGSWFFDKEAGLLGYVLRHSTNNAERKQNMLFFKVELPRLPSKPARPSGAPIANSGVVLNQVDK